MGREENRIETREKEPVGEKGGRERERDPRRRGRYTTPLESWGNGEKENNGVVRVSVLRHSLAVIDPSVVVF